MQPLLNTGDYRWQHMVTGTIMGKGQLRCIPCPCPASDFGHLPSVFEALDRQKDLLERAFHLRAGNKSDGTVRPDALLAGLPMPFTDTQLRNHFDQHRLWSLIDFPDPLHLIINHSRRLRSALLKLPFAVIQALDAALKPSCGTTLTLGAHAGWQWRAMWASSAWNEQLSAPEHRLQLLIVRSFARCIAAMYAPAALWTPKLLLRFAADAFLHHVLCVKLSIPLLLAEHSLFPHMPMLAMQLPPSFALSEPIERVFKPIRKIHESGMARGEHSVDKTMERLLLWHATQQAKEDVWRTSPLPVAQEPCVHCIENGHLRTVVERSVVGDTMPLLRFFSLLGFDGSSYTASIIGDVELKDAHLDPQPTAPVLPSLSAMAAAVALKRKERAHALFGSPVPPLAPTIIVHPAAAALLREPAHELPPPRPAAPAQVPLSGKEEKQSAPARKRETEPELRDEHASFTEDDWLTDEDWQAAFTSIEEDEAERKVEAKEEAEEKKDDDYSRSGKRKKSRKHSHARKQDTCAQCGKLRTSARLADKRIYASSASLPAAKPSKPGKAKASASKKRKGM